MKDITADQVLGLIENAAIIEVASDYDTETANWFTNQWDEEEKDPMLIDSENASVSLSDLSGAQIDTDGTVTLTNGLRLKFYTQIVAENARC